MQTRKPWLNEPDHLEFRYKGYPCIIHRVKTHGALCGYVGIQKKHPHFGKDKDEIDVSVHGGLTYSASCDGSICHTPAKGESDEVWWIGFDCVHWLDIAPDMEKFMQEAEKHRPDIAEAAKMEEKMQNFVFPKIKRTYKTVAFVKNEIRNLVKQLERCAG